MQQRGQDPEASADEAGDDGPRGVPDPSHAEGTEPLTGAAWRHAWAALDERRRAHLRETVAAGRAVRDLHGARLGVSLARRMRRETLAVTLLLPPAGVAAVVVAVAVAAAIVRGGGVGVHLRQGLDVVLRWPGVIGVGAAVGGLVAATHPFRRRLRDAEVACLRAIGAARENPPGVVDRWARPPGDPGRTSSPRGS